MYYPGIGRFLTKDLWQGDTLMPMSYNAWSYVYANPINLTDPTGMIPDWCRTMKTKAAYHDCILSYYHVRPIGDINTATKKLQAVLDVMGVQFLIELAAILKV